MRARWKLIGLAGVAGRGGHRRRRRPPAARPQARYDPDELRDRLHRRLAEAIAGADAPPGDDPGDAIRHAP